MPMKKKQFTEDEKWEIVESAKAVFLVETHNIDEYMQKVTTLVHLLGLKFDEER